MATKSIPTADFSLSSSWSTRSDNTVVDAPTTGSKSVTFSYELPSGAKIKKSSVWATLGSPLSGIGFVKANGTSMNQRWNAERGADVSLSGTSGSITVTFEFKATGSTIGVHVGTLSFSSVYLWIEYEEGNTVGGSSSGSSAGSGSAAKVTSYQSNKPLPLRAPPQTTCLYSQGDGHIYLFDCVEKVQHSISNDIQEEPSKNKDKYVNNARNDPDKVTIDIVMSDVYADQGDIVMDAGSFTASQRSAYNATKSMLEHPFAGADNWSRSQNAYYTLYNLKWYRTKLSLITPHYVYTDMIIASITSTYDNTCPNGLIAQITLQGAYDTSSSSSVSSNSTSSKASSTEARPTESIAYQNFGTIIPGAA